MRQPLLAERRAVDDKRALGQPMPAEQQPDQARLSGAGQTDNRDMLAGTDREIDVTEDAVAASDHEPIGDLDRNTGRRPSNRRRPRNGFRRIGRLKRLHQPEKNVPLRRILMGDRADLAADRRKAQHPVDEQHVSAGDAARACEMVEQKPAREEPGQQRLQAAGPEPGPQGAEARSGPFGEQALMLAAHLLLGPVGADRHQPDERVEIEARQRTGLPAHPEIALVQDRLEQEWRPQHACQDAEREDGAGRRDHHDAAQREHQLEKRLRQLHRKARRCAHDMDGMGPVREVRHRPAPEIAILEPRQLGEQAGAQAAVELPSQPHALRRQRQTEEQDQRQKAEQRR